MSDQDLLTTIKFTVDGSGVESGLTSVKRSIKDLGDAVKSISDKTNDALGKVGTTDLPVAKGLTKASKDIIKQTGDIEKAIATFGSAASTSLRSAYKSIEAEEVRMRGMGIDPAIMNPYLDKLKEVQKLSAAVANQDRKIAAEQAAAQQKIFDTEAHYAALKVQHAAHNKSIADKEIASTKARADALKAYYAEAQNAELNLIHTGRGKSSAMLTDKGQRLGFTDAEINTAVSGLKRVEEANKTAFAAANPHLEKLRAQAEASNTSVKGLTASLRNVPAQFTDIIVSLQGGQAPLTVLLQQGGQLKDMFGGVGNAAKALGGYVLGLVNPFTLTAGAAAALYMAYSAGSDEARAFNKSLITTGNAAGVTAGQLAAMAQSVSLATGGTVGSASGALASLAGSKNIAAGQFEKIADLAVQMEKATGVAVDKTVEKFAELGKDPVVASEKLNQSINYLTASVYEQIKALTDQGRTIEAGIVAQDAFFEVNRQRTAPLLENLSRTTQAYKILAGWVAKVADVAKEPFRAPDIMADLSKQIAIREGFVRNKFTGEVDATDKTLIGLKEQFAYHKHIADSQRDYAAAQAESIKRDEASIAISKEADKYATKQVQLQREIAKAASDYNNSNRTSKDLENYKKLVVGIQNKFKETPASAKAAKAASDAYMSLYESLLKNNEQSLIELDTGTKITARAREHLDALKQINAEYRKGKIGVVESEVLKSIADETAANRARAEASKEAIKADQDGYKAMHDLQKQAEADYKTSAKAAQEYILTAKEYADVVGMEANLVGLNTEQRKLAIEQYKIEADWKKEIARIDGMSNQSDAQKAELKAQYSAAMITKLNASTTKSFQDQWLTASDSIRDSLINSFDDAILTGKSLFTSLRDAAVKLFDGLVLRPVLQGVIGPSATALTGSLIGTAANAATGASATSGLLGNAASLASLGSSFGDGFMATLGGSSISGGGAAALLGGGSSMAGMVGAAAPYALAALAVAKLFSGPGFTSATGTGAAFRRYDATGTSNYQVGNEGTQAQIDAAYASVDSLAKAYFDTASSLGIKAVQAGFAFGTNTGREGVNPNTVIGSSTNPQNVYNSGEISSGNTAEVQLAASRAVFFALQASELPGYLASVFNNITASTASQDQITATLQYAQSLKTVREALLETRTPLQVLQDSVASTFAELGTSADTFKRDFVAAIDAGMNAESLAKWQGLDTTMKSLDTSMTAASKAIADTAKAAADAAIKFQQTYTSIRASQMALGGASQSSISQYNIQAQIDAAFAAYKTTDRFDIANAQQFSTITQADLANYTAEQQGYIATMLSGLSQLAASVNSNTTATASNTDTLSSWATDRQALLDQLTGLRSEATASYVAAQKEVTNAQMQVANVLKSTINTFQGFIDGMDGAASPLQNLRTARATFGDLGAAAGAGDEAALAKMPAAARAYLDLSKRYSATAQDYRRDEAGVRLAMTNVVTNANGLLKQLPEQMQVDTGPLKSAYDALTLATNHQAYALATVVALNAPMADASTNLNARYVALGQKLAAFGVTVDTSLAQQLADMIPDLGLPINIADEVLDRIDNGLYVPSMGADFDLSAIATRLLTQYINDHTMYQGAGLGAGNSYSLSQAQSAANVSAAAGYSNTDIRTGLGNYLTAADAASAADALHLSNTTYAGLGGASFNRSQLQDAYDVSIASGYTNADIVAGMGSYLTAEAVRQAAHDLRIPGFAVGTNYVPQDMLAQIHQGEAIIPAAFNPERYGATSGNDALVAEIKALREEVKGLRAEQKAGQTVIAKHTESTANTLAVVTRGGRAIQTEAFV